MKLNEVLSAVTQNLNYETLLTRRLSILVWKGMQKSYNVEQAGYRRDFFHIWLILVTF